MNDYDSERSHFFSRAGKRLFDEIMRLRQKKLENGEIISDYAEQAQKKSGDEQAGTKPEELPESGWSPEADEPVREEKPAPCASRRADPWKHDITLVDLLDWYQNNEQNPVRGQEKALVKMTLKTIMLNSISLEAPAGGGKTYIINALTSVIPDDIAYRFEFGTEAALFNNYEEINRHKILILPEYQKMLKSSPQIKEVIKTITEGRVAKRQKMGDSSEIVQQYIYPKCVITAIADENEFKETLNRDKEDMRRFSHVRLDSSDENTYKIREFKRQSRSMRPELRKVAPESLREGISAHISECIDLKLDSPPLDPFAEYMDQYFPITTKSIAYIDDYYSYLDGCAKFHHKDRMLENGRKSLLVLNLADHYIIHQIYHAEFCKTLLKLDNLESFGDKGQKALEPVNWGACFEAGIAKMKENFPDVVVNKWIARQISDKKLSVPDVIKQGEVALFDYEL